MSYLETMLVSLIIVPISFFTGYKLRPVIPERKRLILGFMVVFTILMVLLCIDLLSAINISKTGIGTAIAIGFLLGLAGPPFKKNR